MTGVEALVEVSVSDPLARDVPALGWRCEAYDHHQRYHRQIGKTIRTTRNPLHMVRCPLILSQPFHFEFSAGLDNYFRLAKYFLSVNTDVIAVRQLSVVVIRPTSTDCGVSRPVVSPLLSVFLGLHGHLSP